MAVSASPAERSLIARIIIDPEQIVNIDGLEPEDFGYSDLAKVYYTIRNMYDRNESIDAVLVGEESGVEIDVLELSPASFAPIEHYVTAIKEAALRRKLLNIIDSARAKLDAGTGDAVGIITSAVERIVDTRGVKGLRSVASVTDAYREEFPKRKTATDTIPFGIPAIDDALLPMRPGRLVVLASRPGIGKTALAETIGDNAARYGPVLFVSLEMLAEELVDRAMARASGIKAEAILRGEVDLEKLTEYLDERSKLPITYIDDGKTNTSDIYTAGKRVKIKNSGKLALIIVDYLQLIDDKNDDEVSRVSSIAYALKRIATSLRVPVLALSQLNRSMELVKRAPKLSDLRSSGVIEQAADIVGIMDGLPEHSARVLHILKQRQGHPGIVQLEFDGDLQRWNSPSTERMSW